MARSCLFLTFTFFTVFLTHGTIPVVLAQGGPTHSIGSSLDTKCDTPTPGSEVVGAKSLKTVVEMAGDESLSKASKAESPSPPCPQSIDKQAEILEENADFVEYHLIIGRTSWEKKKDKSINEQLPNISSQNQIGIWVYGDSNAQPDPDVPLETKASAGALRNTVVLDYNNPSCLKKFPEGVFTRIIFDRSVWKFFNAGPSKLLPLYARMLKPGGKLVFERSDTHTWDPSYHDGPPDITFEPENIPHGFSLRSSLSEAERREKAAEAYAEMDRRYQAHVKSLGFSSLKIYPKGTKKYPIPTNYDRDGGLAPYYEFTK